MQLPEIHDCEVLPLLRLHGLPVRRATLQPRDLVHCLRGQLACTLDRVYAAIKRGELPAVNIAPTDSKHARWRLAPADVARWILARELFWLNSPATTIPRRKR